MKAFTFYYCKHIVSGRAFLRVETSITHRLMCFIWNKWKRNWFVRTLWFNRQKENSRETENGVVWMVGILWSAEQKNCCNQHLKQKMEATKKIKEWVSYYCQFTSNAPLCEADTERYNWHFYPSIYTHSSSESTKLNYTVLHTPEAKSNNEYVLWMIHIIIISDFVSVKNAATTIAVLWHLQHVVICIKFIKVFDILSVFNLLDEPDRHICVRLFGSSLTSILCNTKLILELNK